MESYFNVSGRLALVTGSNRGLGRTLARGLAGSGAKVIIHGRDAKAVESTATELEKDFNTQVFSAVFDVTDVRAVKAGVQNIIEQIGVPDILVNNAGIQRRAPFAQFDFQDWDDVIATNLSSLFYVTRAFAPAFVQRESGKIINIGSVQSVAARQTIAPYSAAKGGVAMLTRGMTADLARFNIQVNTLSPGYFATDMNTALWQDPEFDAWLRERTPARRWGKEEELIGTLLYLSSPASDFVCGQNILVDGGMTSVV